MNPELLLLKTTSNEEFDKMKKNDLLNFSPINFKFKSIRDFHIAFFLSEKILMIKSTSIQKSDLFVGDVKGKNLYRLRWKRKVEEKGKKYIYKYENIFICPKKILLFISGKVKIEYYEGKKKKVEPEKNLKGKKGKKKKGNLAAFLEKKNNLKSYERSFIEVLFIPSICKAFTQEVKKNKK